ncbi:hypothetical protein FQA39_LY16367 [Lamprigera yunnana]|nr:hypothetical protein FQA39_LY16367 [Lamprigera yunnana]
MRSSPFILSQHVQIGALNVGVQCAPQLSRAAPRQPDFSNTLFEQGQNIPTQHLRSQNNLHQQLRRAPGINTESEDYEIYQNQNANYQFSSNIEDHINDLTNQRQEIREGDAVKGSYSYSDGYFKISVNYIADKDGYRVTGMEATPLDGPRIDLTGTASISSTAHGTQLQYKVGSIPSQTEPLDKFPNRNLQFN